MRILHQRTLSFDREEDQDDPFHPAAPAILRALEARTLGTLLGGYGEPLSPVPIVRCLIHNL